MALYRGNKMSVVCFRYIPMEYKSSISLADFQIMVNTTEHNTPTQDRVKQFLLALKNVAE